MRLRVWQLSLCSILSYVILLFVPQIHSAFAQACVNPTDCEEIRRAQMEERFLNEREDAFKDNRQAFVMYRESAGQNNFMYVVYRDGRVEFSGRPTEKGHHHDLATYPYLISQSSVSKIELAIRKYDFMGMPKRVRAAPLTTHVTHFSLAVKERDDAAAFVRVFGTSIEQYSPVGLQELVAEIYGLAVVESFSCSTVRGVAPCGKTR